MEIEMTDGTVEEVAYSEIQHINTKRPWNIDRQLFHNPDEPIELNVVSAIYIPSLNTNGLVSYQFKNYLPWMDINDLPYDEDHLKELVVSDAIKLDEIEVNTSIWRTLALIDKTFREKGRYPIDEETLLKMRRRL